MSHFYSDMITWTVAGLTVSAVLLGRADLAPVDGRPSAAVPSEPVVVASAQPLAASVVTDAQVTEVVAPPERTALPQVIPSAELLEVNFTTSGDDLGVPPLDDSARGVVTGQSVNLRSGPGTGFQIVSRAVRNDKLLVTGKTDGIWIQVLAPISEQEAWIHGNYFDAPGG